MNKYPYDETNIVDILRHSLKLKGMTFGDVLSKEFQGKELKEKIIYYNNQNNKGGLGNLLEKYYFYYSPNNLPTVDFPKAGLELKVTPYEKTKNGLKAAERLVIAMIPNNMEISPSFSGSQLENKINKLLIVWYRRNKSKPRINSRIDYVALFDFKSPILARDFAIICDDYRIIAEKIIAGKAHELSESDTRYLGACTKGATASKSLQAQYYNKNVLAKRRAFSLKQSYMTYILNNYVLQGKAFYESILKSDSLTYYDFDKFVIEKIDNHIGEFEDDLYVKYDLPLTNKSKQINKILVLRMLGINTSNAEEFAKANIVVKTIRVAKSGKPRESMSFPKIVIKDFIRQNFETSYERTFFEKTRFLFVVFQECENGKYALSGSKFWNMPINELDNIGKTEWQAYRNKFATGINFIVTKTKSGKVIVKNDLPKKSNHKIFHIRPHARKSAYLIDGVKYGNGTDADMDTLPNGNKITHQCFWLNNEYVAKIVKDIIGGGK